MDVKHLSGSPKFIYQTILKIYPEAQEVICDVRDRITLSKRQIDNRPNQAPWQSALLYALAKRYDEGRILEIGTAYGYSAAIMAEAAPDAEIITLNPKESEFEIACHNLANYRNVVPVNRSSGDYRQDYGAARFDLVFVDGDHQSVHIDFAWYANLDSGGLILFHDYSPADAKRPCSVVYERVNIFRQVILKREEFDILAVDTGKVGMAGFYKG